MESLPTRIHLATSQLEEVVGQLRSLLPCSTEAELRAENARLLALLRSHPPPRPAMLPARRLKLAAAQAWRCALCGETLTEAFHADHRIPWSETFDDRDEALQIVCVPCHMAKTSQEQSDRRRGGSAGGGAV